MLPPGFNIAPVEEPSITSGLTQEAVEDEDISLLGGSPLALDQAREDISLIGDKNYLICNGVYSSEDASLGASTPGSPAFPPPGTQATPQKKQLGEEIQPPNLEINL